MELLGPEASSAYRPWVDQMICLVVPLVDILCLTPESHQLLMLMITVVPKSKSSSGRIEQATRRRSCHTRRGCQAISDQ